MVYYKNSSFWGSSNLKSFPLLQTIWFILESTGGGIMKYLKYASYIFILTPPADTHV